MLTRLTLEDKIMRGFAVTIGVLGTTMIITQMVMAYS